MAAGTALGRIPTRLRIPAWLRGRGSGSMLAQVRRMFLALCLLWPVFGVPALILDRTGRYPLSATAVVVVLELWWVRGVRRGGFPVWDWVPTSACVGFIMWSTHLEYSIQLFYLWIGLRTLYSTRVQTVVGATIAIAGLIVAEQAHGQLHTVVPAAFYVPVGLVLVRMLTRSAASRDRTHAREQLAIAAGARLMAVADRAEAIRVVLDAAMCVDRAVDSVGILIGNTRGMRIAGTAGNHGPLARRSLAPGDLPPEVLATLAGQAVATTGASAAGLAAAAGLPADGGAVLGWLSAHGETFGVLVVALHSRPSDDLSKVVDLLASQTALTLDRLLADERFRVITEHSPDVLVLAAPDYAIRYANPTAQRVLGLCGPHARATDLRTFLHPDDLAAAFPADAEVERTIAPCRMRASDEDAWEDLEAVVVPIHENDGLLSILVHARDVSQRRRLELELRHAQKLESVGRLAAGIAHEINTPVQFVGDNVRFLRQTFTDLLRLHDAYRAALGTGTAGEIRELEAAIDLDFLTDEVPEALSQTIDGVNRVATIVRAMKAFGHPGDTTMVPVQLNDAITNTLIVANNELKYVADIRTDLADLPPVTCHPGDLNQVILNLLVNAAHAIAATDQRGTITVTTAVDEGEAVITVTDTGTGIPPEITDKIFDPFFTTKDVGTGTGQGLALARSLIVDRHNGHIGFTTRPGTGTTFTVRLPLNPVAAS